MAKKGKSKGTCRFSSVLLGLPFLALSQRLPGPIGPTRSTWDAEETVTDIKENGRAADLIAAIEGISSAYGQGQINAATRTRAKSMLRAIDRRSDLTSDEKDALKAILKPTIK